MEKELRQKIAVVIFLCWIGLAAIGIFMVVELDEGVNYIIAYCVLSIGLTAIVDRYLKKLIK